MCSIKRLFTYLKCLWKKIKKCFLGINLDNLFKVIGHFGWLRLMLLIVSCYERS